jgi:general secretion pathway protein B
VSFILDALKKSENERQRQTGPSLADVPISRSETQKPWWAFAVAGLLVVNLVVLVVVLLRNDDPAEAPPTRVAMPEQQQQYIPPPAPVRQQVPQPVQPPAGNPAVHPLADEASTPIGEQPVDPSLAANPGLASAANVPEGPPLVRPIQPPAVAPAPATATFAARNAAAANEVLPTPMDLAASGKQLPDLHLDIHVFSAVPAERFVLVNMRRYGEGQLLSEGPTVEQITSEGVVLNHRGLRFLLPRP